MHFDLLCIAYSNGREACSQLSSYGCLLLLKTLYTYQLISSASIILTVLHAFPSSIDWRINFVYVQIIHLKHTLDLVQPLLEAMKGSKCQLLNAYASVSGQGDIVQLASMSL